MRKVPKIGEFFTLKTKINDREKAEKTCLRIVTKVILSSNTVFYNIVPKSPHHTINVFEYDCGLDEIDILSREEFPEYYL